MLSKLCSFRSDLPIDWQKSKQWLRSNLLTQAQQEAAARQSPRKEDLLA